MPDEKRRHGGKRFKPTGLADGLTGKRRSEHDEEQLVQLVQSV
jgi:hypothetical protein